ncbi:DNA-binding protein [Mesobacillus harenae]|uniref:DNA-binding protein n=1 Tax=Mesobacillus harenae TaxID=2213203 RepID=UPI001580FC81|nr:DNA-binding protein [Mesobacillus harenae]
MNQPTIDEGIGKLKLVLGGEMTREEAAEWAEFFVMCDIPAIEDEKVWDLLIIISGIDILYSPTSYLHSEEDIEEWIKEA